MNQPQQVTEKQLEELKKKYGIDEGIAQKYDVAKERVQKDFDPRLVRVILEYLRQKPAA